MQRVKKKKERTGGKPVTLTRKQIEKIKQDVTKKATQKAMLICLGVMADYHNMSEDEICEFAEQLHRIGEWEEKDWIRLDELADIIEKKTGLRFNT